ncbi:MAG: DUF5666 domain-containing protein [Parcubacteria group bacterium]|jgi:hypothetical protein
MIFDIGNVPTNQSKNNMSQNNKDQKKSESDSVSNGGEKKTKRSSLKRTVIVLAVLLSVVLAFNAVIFFVGMKTNYLHRWASGQYFGEIIEMNGGSFVIHGRGDDSLTFLITERTVIKKGTETIKDALQIGDRVIVFGPLDSNGRVESQLIRVFDPENPMDPRDFFQPPF